MGSIDEDLIGLSVVGDAVKQCVSPPQAYSDKFEQECFSFLSAISREREQIKRAQRVALAAAKTAGAKPADPTLVDEAVQKKTAKS